MSSQLSRQLIKENYRNPHHAYKPEEFDVRHELKNLSCGDEIIIYIKFSKSQNTIDEIHFEARACALTIATASILTRELSNKPIDELKDLDTEYLNELLDTKLSMNRVKCSLLPLRGIQQAIGLREKQEQF
jgi:nitrogen fixation NifU-like protein